MDDSIFRSWILASCNYTKYSETFWQQWKELLKEGIFYDPNQRRFTRFYDKIDSVPENIWYLYRPVAFSKAPKELHILNEYKLQIINTETLKTTPTTIDIMEKNLMRRYYNTHISKVSVAYLETHKPEIRLPSDVNCQFYSYKTAKELNEILKKQMTDLIIVSDDILTEKNIVHKNVINVDGFVPTYPIVYNKHTIGLTPIQIQQINGVNPQTSDVVQSLLNRISSELGAILTVGNFKIPNVIPESILEGISDTESGIFRDGRVKLVVPKTVKNIPRFGHGWISNATLAILSSVCFYTTPKVIFELGAWYGLSSRVISHNMTQPYTIYSVDIFKNSAITTESYNRNSPSNKMFYNHLRYETRCANEVPKNNEVEISRYFFDKPVSIVQGAEHSTVILKMDIYEAIEKLHSEKISPNVIFVDFEKKTQKLISLLHKLIKYFPGAIIVGDDLISDSVKFAIKEVKKTIPHVYEFGEAYVIYPKMNKCYEFINTKVRKDINILRKFGKLDIFKPFVTYPLSTTSNNITEFCKRNYGKEENTILLQEIEENIDEWLIFFPNPIINPGAYTFFDYVYRKIKFD